MKIEILVGNIASGKSTYAKSRAEDGAIIINDDAIVSALHGGYYKLYSKKNKKIYKTIELNIMTICICHNIDCIIDRGLNITRASRKRFVSISNSFEVPCDAIIFDFNEPEIHAKRRYDSGNRGFSLDYWTRVATRMNNEYEKPNLEEGFGQIFTHKMWRI